VVKVPREWQDRFLGSSRRHFEHVLEVDGDSLLDDAVGTFPEVGVDPGGDRESVGHVQRGSIGHLDVIVDAVEVQPAVRARRIAILVLRRIGIVSGKALES
jgi:hypothetical protein